MTPEQAYDLLLQLHVANHLLGLLIIWIQVVLVAVAAGVALQFIRR